MNKQQLHKEFDDHFKEGDLYNTPEKAYLTLIAIKSFYDSKITQILKEIVGEESEWDCDKCKGYNNKHSEIIEKIKEMEYD